jgi:hypothetical protein
MLDTLSQALAVCVGRNVEVEVVDSFPHMIRI